MRALVLAVVVTVAGCSRPLAQARTERFEPPLPGEVAARERAAEPRCNARRGTLFPGVAQICQGKERDGAVLASVAAAELIGGVAVGIAEGFDHPGAFLPLLGLSDLWIYSLADARIEDDRAAEKLYAPADTLDDLVAAPFNIQVMKRPEVWAGLLAMLGAGVAVSLAVDDQLGAGDLETAFDQRPNVFGFRPRRSVGYSVGIAAQAGLFYQVAIAEEALFRGLIQSSWVRAHGETWGWLEASMVFGAAHAFNILLLPREDWGAYLGVGVPFITALGTYLGWVYREGDYSLAPPVALHFWYDLLLSATFFAIDPESSAVSASWGWSF